MQTQNPQHHIELSTRARRDLKKIPKGSRRRVVEEISGRLSPIPLPGNADIDPLSGRAPFMRLRVGDYRAIFRPLTPTEMARLVMQRGALDGPVGYLIARIVDRKDLEKAVRTLEFGEVG
jgi:mRNA-degrading endonuclease RelE of RelBE toxin-antitoxin system